MNSFNKYNTTRKPWRVEKTRECQNFCRDEKALRERVVAIFKPAAITHYHKDVDSIFMPSWEYYVDGLIHILQPPPGLAFTDVQRWTADYYETLLITATQTLSHLIPKEECKHLAWRMSHDAQLGCLTLLMEHHKCLGIHPAYLKETTR